MSLGGRLRRSFGRKYYRLRYGGRSSREYSFSLPEGFGHRQMRMCLSVPKMPRPQHFRFAEHVVDHLGKPTRTVLTTALGGFALSENLGETWRFIPVPGYEGYAFIHVFPLGGAEYLAQVKPADLERNRAIPVDLLILGESGQVLDRKAAQGVRWHGCRAVQMANGTLMYAEYPRNKDDARSSSRVFRSRDRGRSWNVVFEQSPEQVRHFHLLQPRLESPGEWWLTSGDAPHQSKIWISRDDGDTWVDVTLDSPLTIADTQYPLSIFRLTDLFWNGPEVIWGTDDVLATLGAQSGARVFRSPIDTTLAPRIVGSTGWAVRNLVEVGEFLIVLTQASNQPATPRALNRPRVFLMPKQPAGDAPELFHLFDVENYMPDPTAGKGFTYSRASRSALDGTFFTYRAPYQALPLPHQILRWDVSFS